MSEINLMQFARRWASHTRDGDKAVLLSGETANVLSDAIRTMLTVTDKVWMTYHHRELTDEEKYGPISERITCPECGEPIPTPEDHDNHHVDEDVRHRLREVVKTLQAADAANGVPICFNQLAYDIEKLLE